MKNPRNNASITIRLPASVKKRFEQQAAAAKISMTRLMSIYLDLVTRGTASKIKKLIQVHQRLSKVYSYWEEVVDRELVLMDAGDSFYESINPESADLDEVNSGIGEVLEALKD